MIAFLERTHELSLVKTMSFKKITPDQKNAFLSSLRAGHYNLLLGAGSSMDSANKLGLLPSGDTFKKGLCLLKGVSENYSLQRVFALLKDNEVNQHVFDRFVDCTPGPTAKLIASFVWKRIFTWNVDDVLESAYASDDARQKLISLHFTDDYVEAQNLAELLLIHLHGSVLAPYKGYVFSRSEYLNQIKNISHWMTVLTQFMATDPFIVSGTSLDEIDLDFYLSHRTHVTSREDRGPSILVEMADDAITQDICDKHNLLHFVGYSGDFFSYCQQMLPNRPTPYDLIPLEAQRFLPASVSKPMALAFTSEFEIVPASAKSIQEPTRFLYGHSPTWVDIASEKDISRPIGNQIISLIETRFQKATGPRIVLLSETAGSGKTTTLRRVAFELAGRGIRTLLCSALSRINNDTATVIDLIEGPLVLVVDDFADQVSSITDLVNRIKKDDVVVLGAARDYRLRYVRQALGGTRFKLFDETPLGKTEIARLLASYIKFGLVGDHTALRDQRDFARKLDGDPIAVACCRILNDFRPLDGIVGDLVDAASKKDLDRYLMVSLAQHCFMSGLRYEVMIGAVGSAGLSEQFSRNHPLPLTFSDIQNTFTVPENSTIAERILALVAENDKPRILKVFVDLANAIAPRVNRRMIIRKTPESRLSGRLFNYDDIVRKFLQGDASAFYAQTRSSWKWNSRYWEQVALLNLTEYYQKPSTDQGRVALEQAVQHARHAVSIELHPFPLATLGKVLMTQMLVPGYSVQQIYSEAFEKLSKAIELEASWSRMAVHPYVSLFHGTINYIDNNGVLSTRQVSSLRTILASAKNEFYRDIEIRQLIDDLETRL